ncbi:MAG TPA: hypothetical protein DDZ90_09815, partial [Planctomycetaceae bacterium]|nr:hypothetical protein [Planctomycetaceae bacterium]
MNLELSICDIFSSRLKLREELIFTLQTENRQEYYILNDPLHSRYFRVGVTEYAFLKLLDGQSTVQDSYSRMSTEMPFHHLTSDDIVSLCQWALGRDLIRHQNPHYHQASANVNSSKPNKSKFNLILFRFPLGKPDHFFTRAEQLWGWLFHPQILIGWLLLLLFASFRIGSNW